MPRVTVFDVNEAVVVELGAYGILLWGFFVCFFSPPTNQMSSGH